MERSFVFRQILVLITACLAVLGLVGGWLYYGTLLPKPIRLQVGGCPVLGREGAPIEMVLFEDFHCVGCKVFNQEILPKIYENYIESGQVKFTIVPLAFLQGSKPLANAALAVYEIAPKQILPYMHGLCQGFSASDTPSVVQQKLVNLAKVVGDIDLLAFKSCIMTDCHEEKLEKNFVLAKEVMGKEFGTPTLYINGISNSTNSFISIQKVVENLLNNIDKK